MREEVQRRRGVLTSDLEVETAFLRVPGVLEDRLALRAFGASAVRTLSIPWERISLIASL